MTQTDPKEVSNSEYSEKVISCHTHWWCPAGSQSPKMIPPPVNMATHPIRGKSKQLSAERMTLPEQPATISTGQSSLTKTKSELLWEDEDDDQLAVALATQEYKIASRTLQDIQRDVYMKRKMDPGYSDTAIALANLEVVRAKRVLDHVQDYIAQKAADSSYGGQRASTPSPPPSTQVPRDPHVSTQALTPSPFPISQDTAHAIAALSPPTTPKKNVGQGSKQCGSNAGTPRTPGNTYFSTRDNLGSPYPNSRHISVVCGRRVGVFTSW